MKQLPLDNHSSKESQHTITQVFNTIDFRQREGATGELQRRNRQNYSLAIQNPNTNPTLTIFTVSLAADVS